MIKRCLPLLIVLYSFSSSATCYDDECLNYQIIDLGTANSTNTQTEAVAINDQSEIIINNSNYYRSTPFYWSDNTGLIDVSPLINGQKIYLNDINNQGNILGNQSNSIQNTKSYFFSNINTYPEVMNAADIGRNRIWLKAINDSGAVVGDGVNIYSTYSYTKAIEVIPSEKSFSQRNINVFWNGSFGIKYGKTYHAASHATDISNSGSIVGRIDGYDRNLDFIWNAAHWHGVGEIPTYASVTTIEGYYKVHTHTTSGKDIRVSTWFGNDIRSECNINELTGIQFSIGDTGDRCHIYALNDNYLVGSINDNGSTNYFLVNYRAEQTPILEPNNINNFINESQLNDGWIITRLTGINNKNEIVGQAKRPDGMYVAVLLRPTH